ncbi:hypothetical protein [Bifidobacterium catenulatum]|uniref:Uncharacterized protein n=1 Tax=Bifidobacterium catenulatum subsp. kashiwanohense TaxID=630129 RepID=A0AA43P9K7_9BIFI|nr:hypothetical protein [Bifidobacterium catenulatum]MDH7891118.1 hypothetical protein [Bifidobacterium catenulatum subsp. kashiwanohense]
MNQEAITIIVAIIGSGGFGALVPWVLNEIGLPLVFAASDHPY